MTERTGQFPPRPAEGGLARAFTLIELLTVVAIIGLLVGMVVPTIQSIMESMILAQTLVRLNSLSTGATMYKIHATGGRYFPGQDANGLKQVEGTGYFKTAASAYLATCLFKDDTGKFPVEVWAPVEADMIDLDGSRSKKARTILDTPTPQMAILYFVSRREAKGTVDQYKDTDNKIYTDGNCFGNKSPLTQWSPSKLPPFTKDGEFLLIAPGKDRLYASDNGDDVTNW